MPFISQLYDNRVDVDATIYDSEDDPNLPSMVTEIEPIIPEMARVIETIFSYLLTHEEYDEVLYDKFQSLYDIPTETLIRLPLS